MYVTGPQSVCLSAHPTVCLSLIVDVARSSMTRIGGNDGPRWHGMVWHGMGWCHGMVIMWVSFLSAIQLVAK